MAALKSLPGFSFLICPDSAILLEQLAGMLESFPASAGRWERHVFWGDELPGPEFWEALGQQSLFPSSRAIIVRRAQEWPAQVWKNLSSTLASSASDIWPLLCLEGAFERNSPKIPVHILKTSCYAHAEKKGWIWKRPPLSTAGLAAFVRERASRKGLKFSPSAMQLFCDSVLPDASCIGNEIDKLALISPDGNISEEMIGQGSVSPEADAFACVRLLQEGRLASVWKEVGRSDESSLLFFLIALMSREFRLYWQILAGASPRMYPADAAKKQAQARKMGFAGISAGLACLADAEWKVKSGKMTPEQSLEKLLVNLSALCSGNAMTA